MVRRVLATLVLLLASALPVSATTYYVSKGTGIDARNCPTAQNSATPKATIGSGITCLAAGDTLTVSGGIYNETIHDGIAGGSSWATATHISTAPGEIVWLRPSSSVQYVVIFNAAGTGSQYIQFDGINMDGTNAQYATFKVEPYSLSGVDHLPSHIRLNCNNAELTGPVNAAGGGIVVLDQQTPTAGGNEVLNCRIHGEGQTDFQHAMYVKSGNNVITGNDISDFTGGGIHVYNTSYAATANTIANNVIHDPRPDSGAGGGGGLRRHWGIILADGSTSNVVYNNVVYGILDDAGMDGYSEGLLLAATATTNKIYNNTFANNQRNGINVGNGVSTPLNNALTNNISWNNGGFDYLNWGTGTTSTTNLFGVDPSFTDLGANIFSLEPGSAAIDAGTDLSTVFTADILGTMRPSGLGFDIGAYESTMGGGGIIVTASPSCTYVPAVASLIDDSHATWSMGLGASPFTQILRNGVLVAEAYGAQILWYMNQIYVQGDNLAWYYWTGSAFGFISLSDPSGSDCIVSSPALARGISVGWWLRF